MTRGETEVNQKLEGISGDAVEAPACVIGPARTDAAADARRHRGLAVILECRRRKIPITAIAPGTA